MNVFQLTYEARLLSWHELRNNITELPIKEKCIQIDDFWQQVPLVNHYLHSTDISNWPNPWDLLVENTYCTLARALGMCYTLHMIDIKDFELVEAKDNMGNELPLVLVDHAKYVLNYWPDTVISNTSADFSIKKTLDISTLLQKL
jgi:hypothetical protein